MKFLSPRSYLHYPLLIAILCVSTVILIVPNLVPYISKTSCGPGQISSFIYSDSYSRTSLDGWADTAVSSASQGKIWSPSVFRKFNASLLRSSPNSPVATLSIPDASVCSAWAVVTTIFSPTRLLHQLRALPDWCLVVIGDHKTDHQAWHTFALGSSKNRTVYLSPDDQTQLPFRSIRHIPWNHFGRKNIGYLYAISRGAQYIWDTDDDNFLREESYLYELADLAQSAEAIPLAETKSAPHIWNPYPAFKPLNPRSMREVPDAWPRGMPLEFMRVTSASDAATRGSVKADRVGVFQSLANGDPDVDAIFRLTRELPLVFQREKTSIALPHGRVAPFNAQATLWTRQAFWALLLPVTVHGRVSDIWRSYFAQRLMADVGLFTVFTSPVVEQDRNVHSLVADLQAEVPLYTQADQFIRWLQRWKAKESDRLPQKMKQLLVDAYEIGVVEEKDVLLAHAWLDDLREMGYGAENADKAVAETLRRKEEVSLMAPADPVVKNEPNVAVCVSGQVRTLNLEPSDPDHARYWIGMTSKLPPANMTVAESIQRNLYPKLGKPDVFMVVSTRETEYEPKVGDESACESLRPRNGGHLSCSVIEEKNLTIYDQQLWDTFKLRIKLENTVTREREIQGFLQQLKGMWDCHDAIKRHSKATGKEYDWFVRLRPDTYFNNFPSLEKLAVEAVTPTVFRGNSHDCCCGQRDRFAVGRASWMREYFDRLMYLHEGEWNRTDPLLRKHGGWGAEWYAKEVLRVNGVELLPHDEISLCTVKPVHRTRHGQP